MIKSGAYKIIYLFVFLTIKRLPEQPI